VPGDEGEQKSKGTREHRSNGATSSWRCVAFWMAAMITDQLGSNADALETRS
jgi:hypothetical protein